MGNLLQWARVASRLTSGDAGSQAGHATAPVIADRPWQGLDPLEPRLLLTGLPVGPNPLAEFAGQIGTANDLGRISILVKQAGDGDEADQLTLLGLQTRSGDGQFDPAAVAISAVAGPEARILASADDGPGTNDSFLLVELKPGDYQVQVQSQDGSAGRFELVLFLAGDLDGDGRVTELDESTARTSFGSGTGDEGYLPLADADRNGQIGSFDLLQLRRNRQAAAANVEAEAWYSIDFGGRIRGTYRDADNHLVTARLLRGGTGKIWFRRPGNQDAEQVILSGTSTGSALRIITRGRRSSTHVNELITPGPLRRVYAPTTDLVQLHAEQRVGRVRLRDAVGQGTIFIGGDTNDRRVHLRFRRIHESAIVTQPPIGRLVSRMGWTNINDSPDLIKAPSLRALIMRGPFNADLELYQPPGRGRPILSLAAIRGDLTSARWNLAGLARRIWVRGRMKGLTILAAGGIRTVSARAFDDVGLYGGLKTAAWPTDASDFAAEPATIGRVVARRRGSHDQPAAANLQVAAHVVKRVKLGVVDTDNRSQPFGVVGLQVYHVRRFDDAGPVATVGIDAAADVLDRAGDFIVRRLAEPS